MPTPAITNESRNAVSLQVERERQRQQHRRRRERGADDHGLTPAHQPIRKWRSD
jgi:hypothetical protein